MGRTGGLPIHESDANIDPLVAAPQVFERMMQRLQRRTYAPRSGDVVAVFCRREARRCREAGWVEVTHKGCGPGVRLFKVALVAHAHERAHERAHEHKREH